MRSVVKARLVCTARAGFVVGFIGTVSLAGPAVADLNPIIPGMYGDPIAAEAYWQPQLADDSCGLMAVADVVGQVTGNETMIVTDAA